MELSYRQLERTLAQHFRILPDREGTFRSRIKQVQRITKFQSLQFPEGSAVARGDKGRYSAAHLFQFIAVFELINCGYPPALAVDIVADKWLAFSCGFGLAIRHRRRNQSGRIVYLRVMNSTLAELQGRKADADLPGVFVEDEESLHKILKRNDDRIANAYVVLCASDIVLDVLDLIKRAAQLDNPVHDDEFKDWHLIEGGLAGWWMRAEEGWYLDEPPEGDPPVFLYGDIAYLTHEEPQIAQRMRVKSPWDMALGEDDIETLVGMDLLEPNSTPRWSQLTDRGTMVWKYMTRGMKKETGDGDSSEENVDEQV